MRRMLVLILSAFALITLMGCGGGSKELSAELRSQFDGFAKAKASLAEQRAKVAELDAQIKDPSKIVVAEGETAPTVDELKEQVKILRKKVDEEATAFQESLAEFIFELDNELFALQKKNPNALPRPEYVEANHMFSDEQILVAQRWAIKQGDYTRAISTLEDALEKDPDYPALKEALAKAQVDQYMTEERFGLVKKGMLEDEVREKLGQPHPSAIKSYEKEKTVGWFYQREDKGLAGVFFKNGKVYKFDYNYKKPDEKSDDNAVPND